MNDSLIREAVMIIKFQLMGKNCKDYECVKCPMHGHDNLVYRYFDRCQIANVWEFKWEGYEHSSDV
jgi:hypothetical protein